MSQLKFWQTSLSDMSKRAEIKEVGVVGVRRREDGRVRGGHGKRGTRQREAEFG